MTNLVSRLEEISDKKYRDFHAKLIPNIDKDLIIGVRSSEMKKFAKSYYKEKESGDFLKQLPHKYYDENVLHSLLIAQIKDFDQCIEEVERFLPYIDNWAVCDCLSPNVFKKNKSKLLSYIEKWIISKEEYTIRFAIKMLMTHFLDEDFSPDYPEMVSKVTNEAYYVKMMVAWYFATALAKQWDEVIIFIKEQKLEKWTHNKTIQKARESLRITLDQKEYLKSLKV